MTSLLCHFLLELLKFDLLHNCWNEADDEFIHESTISESVHNHTVLVNRGSDLILAASGLVCRLSDLTQSKCTMMAPSLKTDQMSKYGVIGILELFLWKYVLIFEDFLICSSLRSDSGKVSNPVSNNSWINIFAVTVMGYRIPNGSNNLARFDVTVHLVILLM